MHVVNLQFSEGGVSGGREEILLEDGEGPAFLVEGGYDGLLEVVL